MKIVLGTLALILVIFTMNYTYQSLANRKMQDPEIIIHIQNNPLISKDEIHSILISEQLYHPEMTFSQLNINAIEKRIAQIPEVLSVHVYTQLNTEWKIEIQQRNPIVKVINKYDEKFYIDHQGSIINSTVDHTARVLIANGNIGERPDGLNVINIINNDSLKTIYQIDDIYRISNYICTIPFLESQISQIYIREDREIILIPQVGEQIIVFGSANSNEEVKEKFEKLIKFYQEGIKYEGWNKYKEINLKYSGQVVCKKR